MLKKLFKQDHITYFMKEKVNYIQRILKGFKSIFGFGVFSSVFLFHIAFALALALIFKILHKIISSTCSGVVYYVFVVLLSLIVILLFLMSLVTNLRAYEFTKEMSFLKASEYNKIIKKKQGYKDKKYTKGVYLEKDKKAFLCFSFYQGFLIVDRPFWTIKTVLKVLKEAKENRKQGFENFYGWRKIYDDKKNKDYIFYPQVFQLKK
jgi:hypothetical protein